ncbi:hypothetical protein NC653_021534 [Populus alba x Populus x berolinensis]|uniref:Uncharacterized protein n=1 Tax=Populus alba x Populus x berolinensis TaxID=444605 RepID=A0AAD6QDT4_9ROSI|nr:hypothetical protein NC653_021534 [Populus alba x Populus x berolinensis]
MKPKKKRYAVSKHLHLRILKPCSLNNYDGLAVHHGQQSFLTIFLLLLGEFQDPTRNPAVEEQAIMRTHWIGQKHTVSVRRFIVKHCIRLLYKASQPALLV